MGPDFERLADVYLARVYEVRREGLLSEHGVVVEALRHIWNARGSADIEAVQYEADAYIVAPSGVDVTDLQTHLTPVEAIKALDR